MPCALGRSGIIAHKQEGDGATPAGSWPFRKLFYRKDRVNLPAIQLQTSEISEYGGWCDDPECPEYNQLVSLPFSGSHENMWRDDHMYDLVVPLGYNDAPPVAGLGSAIFFHLAHDDYRPTEGCIAVSLEDMRLILPMCGPETVMEILTG